MSLKNGRALINMKFSTINCAVTYLIVPPNVVPGIRFSERLFDLSLQHRCLPVEQMNDIGGKMQPNLIAHGNLFRGGYFHLDFAFSPVCQSYGQHGRLALKLDDFNRSGNTRC